MNAKHGQVESSRDVEVGSSWAAMQAGADLMERLLTPRLGEGNVVVVMPANGAEIGIFHRLVDLQRRVDKTEEAIRDRNGFCLRQGLASIEKSLVRIADALAPQPVDIVDSPHVAAKLGCTTTWIAEMARSGEIPAPCIVAGTGYGRPWKFYRSKIEAWIESR